MQSSPFVFLPLRLRTSGFGRCSLHPGSALSAPHPVACVQTEAARPFQQTYVSTHEQGSCTNFETQISPTGALMNALSDTHFLSVRGINCTSHTCSAPVLFTSQWPISHFLSPRCTGAGEDGQVSFPTRCPRCLCSIASKHSCSIRPDLFIFCTQSKKEKKQNILIIGNCYSSEKNNNFDLAKPTESLIVAEVTSVLSTQTWSGIYFCQNSQKEKKKDCDRLLLPSPGFEFWTQSSMPWLMQCCVCSEALGHENPVFLGGSPQTKTRTVSQIMTRQSSETGRHLLSTPGTPLSPTAHGDVFFPIEGRTWQGDWSSRLLAPMTRG